MKPPSDTQDRYPAVLGLVGDARHRPVTFHRTYLAGGGKGRVDRSKKVMMPTRSPKDAPIRLWSADRGLAIAECIEIAIAASMRRGVAAYSVVSAPGLEQFEQPEGIECVLIAGEPDESQTDQAAAYEAAKQLKGLGYTVDVRTPDIAGDWNDWLVAAKSDHPRVSPTWDEVCGSVQ